MLKIFAIIFILIPTLSNADAYPDFKSLYLNDYADIIDEQTEIRIIQHLKTLYDNHGVEATVLTITSRKDYRASASIESFATGLFNHWGIGNTKQHNGILILVSRQDREMRIELGTGYGRAFDAVAATVIADKFIPYFRNNKYSQGIEAGTLETIRRIAIAHAEAEKPAKTETRKTDTKKYTMLTIVFAFIAFQFRRFFGDFITRFKKCPNCAKRGLHRKRSVTQRASRAATGQGRRTTTCDYCSYYKTDNYIIARISKPSRSRGSSFGGGSSSGGGASGRW